MHNTLEKAYNSVNTVSRKDSINQSSVSNRHRQRQEVNPYSTEKYLWKKCKHKQYALWNCTKFTTDSIISHNLLVNSIISHAPTNLYSNHNLPWMRVTITQNAQLYLYKVLSLLPLSKALQLTIQALTLHPVSFHCVFQSTNQYQQT